MPRKPKTLWEGDDRLLSITEVGLYLGVNYHHARDLVKGGHLGEAYDVSLGEGKVVHLRVRKSSVDAYLAQRAVSA